MHALRRPLKRAIGKDGNYLRIQTHNVFTQCPKIGFIPEFVPSAGAFVLRYRSTGLVQAYAKQKAIPWTNSTYTTGREA
jgi:hypothetical protein